MYRLTIPFSVAINHNLAQRSKSEAIVIIAESRSGLQGIGEGTPRQYVTNETLPDCINAARQLGSQLIGRDWHDWTGLNSLLDQVSDTACAGKNPSAWCALELACLDMEAQHQQKPLWGLFADRPTNPSLTYSAVITMLNQQALEPLLELIGQRSMQFIKVKVADLDTGMDYLRAIRKKLGPDVDIRIDANGAFSAHDALALLQAGTDIGISSFEQPVAGDDMAGFSQVTRQGGVHTIADESFCSQDDMTLLMQSRACSGFNVRLSKCGGFRESLRLWHLAREHGFFCQLGCHVGETGILDTAGRHLATLCPDIRYLEGGYCAFVLESDLCNEQTGFGPGGKARPLTSPGLGVTINMDRLAQWGELVADIS